MQVRERAGMQPGESLGRSRMGHVPFLRLVQRVLGVLLGIGTNWAAEKAQTAPVLGAVASYMTGSQIWGRIVKCAEEGEIGS